VQVSASPLLNVLMAHSVQPSLPGAEYWPAVHEKHDDISETSLKRPPAQSEHELASTSENLPEGQLEHG
jgi:hypothetical protein